MKCSKCQEETGSKRNYCRKCASEYSIEYNLSRKDEIKNKWLVKNYGITLGDYNKLLQQQNYLCYICKTNQTTNKSLCVDHDHSTGKIRGLLCLSCNSFVGLIESQIEKTLKVLEYLKLN